jgi:hypothetical protein
VRAGTLLRVEAASSRRQNDAIRRATERRLALFASHPELIDERLHELDREWDVERVIESEGAATTLAGLALGAFVSRRFLVLPIFAQAMMALHALHGFYPLLPLLRRAGFRTQREIAKERRALLALRGDFHEVGEPTGTPAWRADRAYEVARLRPQGA